MKLLQNVVIETFDGTRFAALYGLRPLEFYAKPNADKLTMTLVVPDSVPDSPTIVFLKLPTDAELIEAALDIGEWDKLDTAEKLETIRLILLGELQAPEPSTPSPDAKAEPGFFSKLLGIFSK